ncbi:aminotransferase class I and II [Beutenbergia cavernae DSM 12333]|uniref:cysteine-S-conjugate beta-lyase n=1 Tax=Beutenbergia cavernae (strain ATCC BAA-8 / DSM 12333 / CCUG 43141 / JCM 11478 / NBRC 16432 / NCIMB 13614 / HKI 0122) TaxID=471853 RepID=C5BXT1_BEUC1|nr:aminotransferase class I/II-fold pyridoxal phosphate-dependent enzyme [Beutenbergia cavernae]ACQ78825.1 aminotransferase class I and II [Beutenbergia cavernae DSM 12333]
MVSPQDLDAITVDDLRARGGIKWSTYPDSIGAFVAEMDFGVAPGIARALHTAVDDAQFGYLPPSLVRTMSEAVSEWYARRHGWQISPERIHPLPDVIKALEVAMEHFSGRGEKVIVTTPAYMPFLKIPELFGREIIRVPMLLDDDDGVWRLDLDGIGRAFADGAGLLVLCNPYNPLGRVFGREELAALADVVTAHGGRVFSDEIHAPLVYPGAHHVPYASISEAAASHTVTATSASKAWNLPGLKCAQLLLSNAADAVEWEKFGFMASHGAANLGVIANTAAFTSGEGWLEEIVTYLDGNRRLLGELLTEHLPDVGYSPPEGTYLAWLDCRELELGAAPGDFFREHAGVAMVDGAACGEEGFVRLNFALPRPVLAQAIEQMGTAVAGRHAA